MIRSATIRILLFVCLVTTAVWASAQQNGGNTDDLRQEIDLTRRLREETRGSEIPIASDVGVIGHEIKLTRSLIRRFQEEIELNEQKILELEETTCQLETDLEQIQANFAQTAVITYKATRNQNFWVMLLSARNLTDAFYRAIYFRQFSRYRANQIRLIKQARLFLEIKKDDLRASIESKKELLEAKGKASIRLVETEIEQKSLLTELRQTGNARLSSRPAEIKGLSGTPGVNPELGVDKGSFEKSRGSLPWPVSVREAIVVSTFGQSEDPFGNLVMNDGIHIRTTRGQTVRAVYDGLISGVTSIPMGGEVVIIQHGPYRTVYDNLTDVKVTIGQKVTRNTVLGTVRTDPRTSETLLHFLIYRHPDKFVDPLRWLSPKR